MTNNRRPGTPQKRGLAAALFLVSGFWLLSHTLSASAASDQLPVRITASYAIYKGALKVGDMEESYTRDKDRYTLTSTTTPISVLAIFKPERISISSSGRIGQHGLQPEQFSHQREFDESKNSRAEFDWEKRALAMFHQKQRNMVALPDNTQDRLSAMYQFMFLPLQHAKALEFPMTNGSELNNLQYAVSPGEKLKTPAGEFNAFYLDSRANSGFNRTEIWLAAERYNLPCKMVITDGDGEKLTQVLTKLIITP